MNNKIKSLLKQAEIFQSQGLLDDTERKYKEAADIIQNSDKIQNKEKLLNALSKKMVALKRHTEIVKQAPTTPEMSDQVNKLIKKLFSVSEESGENKEAQSALEGAVALAKFGQFSAAQQEFERLISVESVKLSAAKNILRCRIALDEVSEGKEVLTTWQKDECFSAEQLRILNKFWDELLNKKGIKPDTVPNKSEQKEEQISSQVETPAMAAEPEVDIDDDEESEEEFLDISAVAITFDSGPHKGEQVELDVSFQSGNIISLIISSKDEALIENLQVGYRLDDVHFYSPIAIFRGSGVVSAKTQISSGPKKGDYSLDIKIESI